MAKAAPDFRHRSVGEIGDQAADLPHEVLARLGGRPHSLRRRIIAPGETPIRTLVHAIGGDAPDGTLTKEIGTRRHQPARRTRQRRRPCEDRPRPAGHRVRELAATPRAEDASTGYAGNGPQVMATLHLAISLLYIAG